MERIAIDFHTIKDQVQSKDVEVNYLHTTGQVVDILKKPFPDSF